MDRQTDSKTEKITYRQKRWTDRRTDIQKEPRTTQSVIYMNVHES